ncbi:MAG: hypothetical protein JSS60_05780 [Verrucomicrobia bacterium]|nr:hypothetical protein [Verrucomicrobiota bacterium]
MRSFFLNRFTALLLSCGAPALAIAAPHSLQEKFTQAKAGDFIVTAQEGNYSILFIRSITVDTLLLEEISVPSRQIDLKKVDWKKWVFEKAPGHTSWTLYEIDRATGALTECFSYSKNGWLFLDESEQFLTRLLSLPLTPTADAERKKIGPQPAPGEHDSRAPWNPPLVVEGRKVERPAFDVVKTQWPDDGSRLALCFIELYFAKELPAFPFPYWLEVHSPHYAFKMRTVDSGHDLISPMVGAMPHRAPQILGAAQKKEDVWNLPIKTPPYFQKLHLFVIDLTGDNKGALPIPFTPIKGETKEEMALEIRTSELQRILASGHRYQWALIPEGSSEIYIESEEAFTWK